ncbi:MAG: hypothetical protein KGQ41_01425 [Alphaproteobacteria bacterium]|nr:hypothetical protein [Alphaproteobacteria bacterium]
MSPASNNALNTLALEAESILGTLGDLLDRETDAVRTADYTTFRDLQNDKNALYNRYRTLLEAIKLRAPQIKEAPDATAERLRKVAARFHSSVEKNMYALDAGSKSVQRVTDRIVRAARESVQSRQSYSPKGHAGQVAGQPISVKVDEVL